MVATAHNARFGRDVMSKVQMSFKTTGLHCPSCSMMVDMTVSDLDGVETTKTDHATGLTVVAFDADVVSAQEIMSAILAAGYEAELA